MFTKLIFGQIEKESVQELNAISKHAQLLFLKNNNSMMIIKTVLFLDSKCITGIRNYIIYNKMI